MKLRLWILPNVMLPGWKRALVELEGPELPETLEDLLELVPERLRGLVPARPRWIVNSRWLEEGAEREARPRPGDEVLVAGVPGEGVTLGLTIASLVISLISTIVSLATLPPKRERGEETSPTYGFGGPANSREEGNVKGVLYGEHRVGGQIVNEGVELSASSAEDATYYAQVSFGEGPIESIAGVDVDTPRDEPITFGPGTSSPRGIRLDDVDLADLDGSELEVRLGTNEQDPMDGFRRTGVEFVVDQDLDAIETTNQIPVSIISVDDAQVDQDNAWDAFGVSFDLDADEYDSMRLRLACPQGLVRYDNSGVPQPHRMDYIVRYQALDSGGSPITSGGNFGDGWVRPRERTLNVKEENAFEFSVPFTFYNPAGFTPETIGYVLRLDPQNGNHDAVTSGFQNPPGWIGGSPVDELTLEGWFYPHDRGPLDASGAARGTCLIRKDPAAAGQGWELRIALRTFTAAPGVLEQYYVPELVVNHTALGLGELRTATGAPVVGIPVARFERFEWHHVAVTYEGSPPGGGNRFRLFWNGALVWEIVGSLDLRHSIGELHVLRDPTDVATNGRAEEVRVYSRALTPADVRATYNEGAGTYGTTSGTLVCGYHFDDNSSSLAVDYSGNGNDLNLSNGANTGFPGWVPRPGSGNTPLRSKWRVQVMRNSEDSTDSAVRDALRWSSVEGLIDELFSYPNEPILGLRTRASEQLSGRRPDVTAIARGRRLCPVWDGIDPANPTYVRTYTNNPAWVALDILLEPRFGLRRYFAESAPDILRFQELADRAEEIVYDLRGNRRTGDQASPLVSPHYDGILYQSTPIGEPQYAGRGQIALRFQSGAPPAHWRAGAYIAWTGEQVADGRVDSNRADGEGAYEIDRIQEINGTWWVYCYWDRLSEGIPCSEGTFLHSNAGATGAYTGTVEGRDVRFRFDGFFDEPRDGWEALLAVLRTARAVPIPQGDRIGLKVAMPRAPVFTVGQASIERGSFEVEYRSPELEASAYLIAFHDRELDYDQSSFRLEDEDVQASASTLGAREDALDGFGMARRMQCARHAQYLLNRRKWIDAVGRYVAPPDSLWYQPGDVIRLASDLLPWGVSGRVTAEGTTTTLKLDRTITFEAATTYLVDVRARDLHFETAEINVAAAGGAGTYPPGTTLTLTAALSFVPHQEALATVYAEDQDFLATVTECTPREDLSVEVAWERYRDELHDDTPPEDLEDPVEQPNANLSGMGSLPPVAEAVRLREVPTADSSAIPVQRLAVSWTVRGEGVDHVRGWRLLYRRLREGFRDPVGWELGASVPSSARHALLELPRTTERGLWEVSVQATGKDGSARTPEASARARRWVMPPVVIPPAPTGFSIDVRGERVRYSWTPVPDWPGLRYEIRRGGWALGQVVAVSGIGAAELLSDDAAGGDANSWGAADPSLYLCAKTADGRYSAPAVLMGALDLDGARMREDVKVANPFFASQAWEDFGTGWQDSGTILASLSGLEIAANPERPGTKLLRFSGSNLAGTYEAARQTVGTEVDSAWPAEEFFVEAFVEAVQDHPSTLFLPVDFADLGGMTWEGPTAPAVGAVGPCTLSIEIRVLGEDEGDSWGPWRAYAPARYYGRLFQLRLVVSRPDEDHDVRILRFSQRISRVPRARFQRDDVDLLLALS